MEAARKDKAASKLSVERVYQKKTQLEHILLRPDTYIGSVEPVTQVSPDQQLSSSWTNRTTAECGALITEVVSLAANVGF